jgi:hypothetical protein
MSPRSPRTNPYESVSSCDYQSRRIDKRVRRAMIGHHIGVWLVQMDVGIAASLFASNIVGCTDVAFLVIGLIAGSIIRDIAICRRVYSIDQSAGWANRRGGCPLR